MVISAELIAILISGIVMFSGLVVLSIKSKRMVQLDERIHIDQEEAAIAEALKQIEIEETVLEKESSLSWVDRKRRELEQSNTGITFPAYVVILTVSMLSIFLVVYKIMGIPIIAIPFSFLGIVIPQKIVDSRLNKNIDEFNDQLVKALRRMSSVMRSGGSLKQALIDVSRSRSMPAVVRIEFRRVLSDIEYGLAIEEALFKLYERTGSNDVKLLAIAVEIQRQLGGNIAQIFDTIGGSISNRKLMEGEVQATLAQARATSTILSLLPIFLGGMLYILSPDFFNPLFETLKGRFLLLTCISLIVTGIFVMNKQVSNIEI